MKLQEINPFVRYCKIHPNPIIYPEMVMACDCRIFYVLQGNGKFFIGNTEYDFQKHTLVFIPSGTKYRFSYDASTDIEFLILNFDLTSEYSQIQESLATNEVSCFDYAQLIAVPDCPPYTETLYMSHFQNAKKDLLAINQYFVDKPFFYAEISSGILKNILFQIISKQTLKSTTSASQITKQVFSYISKNYSAPLTNETIAGAFNFHPYYLNRIFKAETGQSLHHYLIQYRIQEAQVLLSASSLSMQQIADVTGFGTPSQFSITFKKRTGMSPSEYREATKTYFL